MGTTLRMGEPPVTDHGAPATRVHLNIAQQEKTRLRVRVVNDALWPHLRLTAITSHGDIDLTFGMDEAHYLASAISAAADELAGLYEPSQPIEVAS